MVKDHASPNIDFITFHLWAQNWGWVHADSLERSFPRKSFAARYLFVNWFASGNFVITGSGKSSLRNHSIRNKRRNSDFGCRTVVRFVPYSYSAYSFPGKAEPLRTEPVIDLNDDELLGLEAEYDA